MSSCVQDCNCLEGVKADGRSWTDGIVVWRTEGHGNQDNCRALGLYVMVEGAIRAKLDPRPTGTRLELGTTIGSNGDNEIIPCARSRSEIAGADVKRTCATWEIKVCGTKQPIGTSSLGGSDADLLSWCGEDLDPTRCRIEIPRPYRAIRRQIFRVKAERVLN